MQIATHLGSNEKKLAWSTFSSTFQKFSSAAFYCVIAVDFAVEVAYQFHFAAVFNHFSGLQEFSAIDQDKKTMLFQRNPTPVCNKSVQNKMVIWS